MWDDWLCSLRHAQIVNTADSSNTRTTIATVCGNSESKLSDTSWISYKQGICVSWRIVRSLSSPWPPYIAFQHQQEFVKIPGRTSFRERCRNLSKHTKASPLYFSSCCHANLATFPGFNGFLKVLLTLPLGFESAWPVNNFGTLASTGRLAAPPPPPPPTPPPSHLRVWVSRCSENCLRFAVLLQPHSSNSALVQSFVFPHRVFYLRCCFYRRSSNVDKWETTESGK